MKFLPRLPVVALGFQFAAIPTPAAGTQTLAAKTLKLADARTVKLNLPQGFAFFVVAAWLLSTARILRA